MAIGSALVFCYYHGHPSKPEPEKVTPAPPKDEANIEILADADEPPKATPTDERPQEPVIEQPTETEQVAEPEPQKQTEPLPVSPKPPAQKTAPTVRMPTQTTRSGERKVARPTPEKIEENRRALEMAAYAQKLGDSGDPKAAEELRKMVYEENDYVKQHALTALVKIQGKEALPVVIEMAQSEHRAARLRAAYELGKIGDPAGLPVLEQLSQSKNVVLRQGVALSLGKINDKRSLPILFNLVTDSDERTREYARKSLIDLTGLNMHGIREELGEKISRVRFIPPAQERARWEEWWRKNHEYLRWNEEQSRLLIQREL